MNYDDKEIAKQTIVMMYVAEQFQYVSCFFSLLYKITKDTRVRNTANMSLISKAMIKCAERSMGEK